MKENRIEKFGIESSRQARTDKNLIIFLFGINFVIVIFFIMMYFGCNKVCEDLNLILSLKNK